MKNIHNKTAFSLIELLFSIVIIGLTVFILPKLMSQSNRSEDIAMTNDMIYAVESNIYGVLTYSWDENSKDGLNPNKILNTSSTANGLNEDNSSGYRVGHIQGRTRRTFHSPASTASVSLGKEGSIIDDLDDFDGNVFSIASVGEIDYINEFNVSTNIDYVDDATNNTMYESSETIDFVLGLSTGSSRHIKQVACSAYSSSKDINITLKAYSSNIGEGTYVYTKW